MEPEQTPENNTEAITKERKKPNITPEDRAKRAERMREMATKRNELLKRQKAERLETTKEPSKGDEMPQAVKKPRGRPPKDVAKVEAPQALQAPTPVSAPTPPPPPEATIQEKLQQKAPKKAPAKKVVKALHRLKGRN